MKLIKLLIFLTSFMVLGCTPSENEVTVVPKTGVELIAVGSVSFGNVVIGDIREAILKVTNHGPVVVTAFNPSLISPFSVSRITAPCNAGTIPVGASCNVTIRFAPTAKGTYTQSLTIDDKTQQFTGTGLDSAGVLTYSSFSWDLGTVVAGETSIRDIDITNSGDFTVSTPSNNTIVGYTRTLNECGSFIAPRRTCKMRFSIFKQQVGAQTDTLTFTSAETSPFSITVTSTVIPGPPSGSIAFDAPPASIIANGGADVKTITTFPIRDQFGNIVQDGADVSLLGSNVTVVGPSSKTTINGIVSFQIASTTNKGDATVTLLANGASGFLRFRSLAGPGVGEIIAKPYIGTVEANGISQIDIRFNPIRDQFNNVIEDGTPVSFYIKQAGTTCLNFDPSTVPNGTGILQTVVSNSIVGEVSATIIPPTTVGTAVLVAKTGTACGFFTVNYIPGEASGIIGVVSSLPGIYADPSTGITANPPEIIQTSVTIGPVMDQYGNVVVTNSSVSIELTNAIGLVSGTSSFNVNTNASGYATFSMQGIGRRGYINISATKDNASGFNRIWAYGDATLRPERPGAIGNPFKLYMTYRSNLVDPSVNVENWGLIKNWSNLDIQDKNYFGDLKKQAPPTMIHNNLPYFTSYCLFSEGNTTYGSNCFRDDFADSSIYQNTFKINKANQSGDPGASVVSEIANQPRGFQIHQERPVGCYKQDTQPGSPTFGDLVLHESAPFELCNNSTSSDPESALYNNNLNPWFGGSWLTNRAFDLNYSTVGFIPDLGRTLTIGGFYENAVYGGGFISPNNYEVFLSNRHTWNSDFGTSTPFNWLEINNIDQIYGDFPESTVMPSITNSNKDLFMFGGLILQGNSHTNQGPIINYIQSYATSAFMAFDGIVNKWFTLNPGSDPLITAEGQSTEPVGRYQHGMVYIPDNDTLFLAGGKTVDFSLGFSWFEPNDMWSIANVSTRNSLQWNRRCFPCGFPANAHNHPSNFNPDTIAPTPVKMTYNPFLQKVFMIWSDTGYDVSNFNPLTTNKVISIDHTNDYSFASIEDSSLYDMEVNADTGRTYFYKRKTKNAFNSELYYWDMDSGNKQYLKIETDLGGAPAKTFIRELQIHLRGYGKVTDSLQSVLGVGGLVVKIYNNNTDSWDLIGQNSAIIESQDTPAQEITLTFDEAQSKKYVSNEGFVNVIVYPRDLTNSNESGYNELRIDEFYIEGLF